MTKVVIFPENIELNVLDNETILDSGIRSKLNLPHSCKNGDCGACKCKVISGNIKLGAYKQQVLTDEEIDQGYTLLCKAYPATEVILDIPNLLNSFPIKTLPAKVVKIVKSSNTAIITLKLPSSQSFGFNAGQYIEIINQGKNRLYSLASSPGILPEIEVHVRYYQGGVFSEFVWNELQEQSILRFRGPLGNFGLSNTQLPIIMICTGTGFAPIKALLEHMVHKNIKRQVYLYWGNRTYDDFYLLELLSKLSHELNLKQILCLSGQHLDGFFSGYVNDALANDFTGLENYEVYACGNLKMIEDVYNLSVQKLGLLKSNFFSDAFTPSV